MLEEYLVKTKPFMLNLIHMNKKKSKCSSSQTIQALFQQLPSGSSVFYICNIMLYHGPCIVHFVQHLQRFFLDKLLLIIDHTSRCTMCLCPTMNIKSFPSIALTCLSSMILSVTGLFEAEKSPIADFYKWNLWTNQHFVNDISETSFLNPRSKWDVIDNELLHYSGKH